MAAIKFTAPSTPQRKLSVSLSPLPLSFSPHPPSSPCLSVGFDFDVTHFFSLGSSLGLVLASRQMALCRHGAPGNISCTGVLCERATGVICRSIY